MNLLPLATGAPVLDSPSSAAQALPQTVGTRRPFHRRHRSYSREDLFVASVDEEDSLDVLAHQAQAARGPHPNHAADDAGGAAATPGSPTDVVLASSQDGNVANEAAEALRRAEAAAATTTPPPEEVFAENDFSYENLLRLDYNRNRRGEGLELTRLLRLPTVVCRTGGTCSICLDDFEDGARALLLPCKHRFHAACVGHWFHEHRACPNCRVEVR